MSRQLVLGGTLVLALACTGGVDSGDSAPDSGDSGDSAVIAGCDDPFVINDDGCPCDLVRSDDGSVVITNLVENGLNYIPYWAIDAEQDGRAPLCVDALGTRAAFSFGVGIDPFATVYLESSSTGNFQVGQGGTLLTVDAFGASTPSRYGASSWTVGQLTVDDVGDTLSATVTASGLSDQGQGLTIQFNIEVSP